MKKRKNGIVFVVILLVSLLMFAGCEKAGVHDLRGNISDHKYYLDIFDNNGIRTMRTSGRSIDITPNIVQESVYTTNGWGYTDTLSAAITVTIDGSEMLTCGDTCIFYDSRLSPDYEFYLDAEPSTEETHNSVLRNGIMNSVTNTFEKPVVAIIKSQTGNPIYAFSGDNVTWEVEKDLPKFTKLVVDGKALYIHRANFQIVDKLLLD